MLWPALLGAGLLLYNRSYRLALLLLPFPIIYLLNVSQYAVARQRNLIVLWPFMALLAGYAIAWGATAVVKLIQKVRAGAGQAEEGGSWAIARWGIAGLAIAVLAAGPLDAVAYYGSYQATPDSRNVAWAWVQERLREGERFAAELHPWQTQDWPDVLAFDVENPAAPQALTVRPPEWYARHGYKYVVLSSNFKDAWRDGALWAEYKALPVVKEFAGDDKGARGPNIVVVATNDTAGNLPVMQHRVNATLQDFAVMEGYDMVPLTSTGVLAEPAKGSETGTFKAGEAVGLNLYYRALRDGTPADPDWRVWVHMVDAETGETVAQVDAQPLTGQLRSYPEVAHQMWPVSQWHRGEMLAGVYNFNLQATLRAGRYRLETGMWVPPSGPAAEVTYSTEGEDTGEMPRDRVVLGEIEVR
jgi:hypothetical protein